MEGEIRVSEEMGLAGGSGSRLWYAVGLVLIGLAGAAVLVRNWWLGGTLFLDDVLLLSSVVERGYDGFTKPLDNFQIAPLGFLVLQKLAIEGLGVSERVVRLVPTLAALATVPAGALLVWRTCRPIAGLVVYAGLLTNPLWLMQAVRVKPYTLDVLFAVLLLLVAVRYVRGACGRREVAWATAVGAVGCWFSIPFYLVALGLGVVVLVVWVGDRGGAGGRRWWALVVPAVVGGVSGAVHYVWVLRAQRGGEVGEFMDGYWGDALLPLPWAELGAMRQWLRVFEGTVDAATGLALGGGVLLLVLVAVVAGVRARDGVVWLLVAPVLVAVLASAAGAYPMADRLVLYLGPGLLVLAGMGLSWLGDRVGGRSGVVLVWVLGGVVLSGSLAMARRVPSHDELVPVLRAVHERLEAGQSVYLFSGGQRVYDFYAAYVEPGLAFEASRVVRGGQHDEEMHRYAEEFDRLAGMGEVWLVFSRETGVGGLEESGLFDVMLAARGRVLETVASEGARAVRWRGGVERSDVGD
ncbi:MAG: hypothetical protein AAF750_11295 [Planctomycetota bacterium]